MSDQNSSQNYESFFNAIDDFLFVLDGQGNIIDVNDTVTNRLGYSKSDLIGQSVLMVHPVERREEAGQIVGQMLAGQASSCPVPVITKAGVQIPVETTITRGKWDGHEVLFGVTKDISDLKLSEEKFSKLFNLNPSACGLSGLDDHKYIEINAAFTQLLGFAKEEVIGKTAFELNIFSKEVADYIISKQDKNGKISGVETQLRAKDGDIKDVLISSENIFVQSERYRITIVNDITERKASEQEIKIQNKLLMGLSHATDHILSSQVLTKQNITDALKSLGESTMVDRVYIFEQLPSTGAGRGLVSQRYEWSSDQVESQINNPRLQNMSWDDAAPRWYDTFISGNYICGDVEGFPSTEQQGLTSQNILSLLALPIYASNRFWGFIGFDACQKKRAWSEVEIGMLKSIANSFAVVIERMRAEEVYKDQLKEAEKMNKFMVGRELKMVELKKEIELLKNSLPK